MPDLQHEYYIRQPDDAEARGPFTLAQLSSLADTGGLDSRTLYFDAGSEQWLPVAGSDELGILLKNVSTRASQATPLHASAARVLLFASAIVFLLMAFVLMRQDGMHTLSPGVFIFLGLFDIFLGVRVSFIQTRIALVIRLRAALGLGFLGALCWLTTAIPALVFAVIASVCLWLSTVLSGRRALFIDAIAGLAALAGFAYCLL